MSTIKKTMVEALAFVTEHGNMSESNLALLTTQFCEPKSTGTGKPRELVKLFSEAGEMIGRRCSVSKRWLSIDNFFKDVAMCKIVDKMKAKLYTESKAMEKAANEILATARDLTDPAEKLAAFENYDDEMVKAREHRLQTLELDLDEIGGFDTVEELAESMGVEVITSVAKPEAEAEAE